MRTPGASYTEEAKAELIEHGKEVEQLGENQLILAALAAIMDEQYRTGDRSPGWPPLRDTAIRWVLDDRSRL